MANESSSSSSSGPSAVDVITYIGVPLAVLGVLPILYNTVVTLAALSKIKRMLRHSRLTALTRSDVVNRIIEVELPRYAVTPWDRFRDRTEYWSVSRHPSSIPGGSWTTFNWRTNVIGLKTQRLEYADQLRQPQVDADFAELVSYLLDLGAVPDAHGWRLLRSAGLWVPVGCALMTSPDGRETALRIAPLDGSDGHLSLAVSWSSAWTTRDYSHLPPYWVRLPPPPLPSSPSPPYAQDESKPAAGESESSAAKPKDGEEEREGGTTLEKRETASSSSPSLLASARPVALRQPITCQISADGIVAALSQDEQARQASSLHLDSLYIEHLRVRPGRTDGAWFASAATAFGTTSQTVLWNYKIPDDVLAFARRATVPCGVLVLLGVVDEADTPEWAATAENEGPDVALDRFVRRNREQREAMAAEARMPPAQRAEAVRRRMAREGEERLQESKLPLFDPTGFNSSRGLIPV